MSVITKTQVRKSNSGKEKRPQLFEKKLAKLTVDLKLATNEDTRTNFFTKQSGETTLFPNAGSMDNNVSESDYEQTLNNFIEDVKNDSLHNREKIDQFEQLASFLDFVRVEDIKKSEQDGKNSESNLKQTIDKVLPKIRELIKNMSPTYFDFEVEHSEGKFLTVESGLFAGKLTIKDSKQSSEHSKQKKEIDSSSIRLAQSTEFFNSLEEEKRTELVAHLKLDEKKVNFANLYKNWSMRDSGKILSQSQQLQSSEEKLVLQELSKSVPVASSENHTEIIPSDPELVRKFKLQKEPTYHVGHNCLINSGLGFNHKDIKSYVDSFKTRGDGDFEKEFRALIYTKELILTRFNQLIKNRNVTGNKTDKLNYLKKFVIQTYDSDKDLLLTGFEKAGSLDEAAQCFMKFIVETQPKPYLELQIAGPIIAEYGKKGLLVHIQHSQKPETENYYVINTDGSFDNLKYNDKSLEGYMNEVANGERQGVTSLQKDYYDILKITAKPENNIAIPMEHVSASSHVVENPSNSNSKSDINPTNVVRQNIEGGESNVLGENSAATNQSEQPIAEANLSNGVQVPDKDRQQKIMKLFTENKDIKQLLTNFISEKARKLAQDGSMEPRIRCIAAVKLLCEIQSILSLDKIESKELEKIGKLLDPKNWDIELDELKESLKVIFPKERGLDLYDNLSRLASYCPHKIMELIRDNKNGVAEFETSKDKLPLLTEFIDEQLALVKNQPSETVAEKNGALNKKVVAVKESSKGAPPAEAKKSNSDDNESVELLSVAALKESLEGSPPQAEANKSNEASGSGKPLDAINDKKEVALGESVESDKNNVSEKVEKSGGLLNMISGFLGL